jgi:diphosphate-dependent phosphofructokinase
VCKDLSLDGLMLLGGPRSATDAAYLAEYLMQHTDVHTAVVTVPLTIDGSIKNQFIETTVGFDTASKFTSQIVGE